MVWLPKTQGSRPVLFYAAPSGARWESQGFWANWAKANWANSLLHCLFGTFTEIPKIKTRKSTKNLVVSKFYCTFAAKVSNMGKLAFLLCFILSVYPADVNENRRHIHVVRRGSKKSHRGNTVAKIWIEENGEKKIEIAWSELSADEETVILGAIEKHWVLLNKQIDDVFAGKKIKILKLKK